MRGPRGAAAVLLCAALVLSGCTAGGAGNGSASPTALNAADETAKVREQYKKYAACMRGQGVNIPDDPDQQQVDIGNVSTDQMQTAYAACQKLAPAGQFDPAQQAAQLAARRRNAQCMRDNGFPDWPDPDPNNPFVSPPPGADMTKAADVLSECARRNNSSSPKP
jgi:hypothetical protein